MEILGWILLVYICGYFIKFTLSIPVALRIPKLINELCDTPKERVRMLPGFGMIALSSVGWPYLLYAEGFSFFVSPSKERIDVFFTQVITNQMESDSE